MMNTNRSQACDNAAYVLNLLAGLILTAAVIVAMIGIMQTFQTGSAPLVFYASAGAILVGALPFWLGAVFFGAMAELLRSSDATYRVLDGMRSRSTKKPPARAEV
jgi:hypothetical protein